VRWTGAKRTVRVVRTDPGKRAHAVGAAGLPSGLPISTRLLRCGDRTRLTYVVTSARGGGRVSFRVARNPAPAS